MPRFHKFDPVEFNDPEYYNNPSIDPNEAEKQAYETYNLGAVQAFARQRAGENATLSKSQAMRAYGLSAKDMDTLKCQGTTKVWRTGHMAKLYLESDCRKLSEDKAAAKKAKQERGGKNSASAAKTDSKETGKKRGRPRKDQAETKTESDPKNEDEDAESVADAPPRKRRGRPRKETASKVLDIEAEVEQGTET